MTSSRINWTSQSFKPFSSSATRKLIVRLLSSRLKHASDRLLKSEAANKKLSLKLSEAADLKRQLKSAEEENARLVDRNAVMEEGNRKGGSVRELADSYKAQVGALEKVDRDRSKEMTGAFGALCSLSSFLETTC